LDKQKTVGVVQPTEAPVAKTFITSLSAAGLNHLAAAANATPNERGLTQQQQQLVIPLIAGKNDWLLKSSLHQMKQQGIDSVLAEEKTAANGQNRNQDTAVMMRDDNDIKVTTTTQTLDQQAAELLLKEARSNGTAKSTAEYSTTQFTKAIGMSAKDRDEAERKALKHDLATLPDVASLERYDSVPVAAFGVGLLRGMGWSEGEGIGKTNKRVVEPIEFVARPDMRGLGASIGKADFEKKKKFIKPGESREPKGMMRVAPTGDGKVHHFRNMSSRMIPLHSQKLEVKKLVEVLGGPHRGLYGRVVSWKTEGPSTQTDKEKDKTGKPSNPEMEMLVDVKLNISDSVVSVPRPALQLLDEFALPKDHPAFSTDPAKAPAAPETLTFMPENMLPAAQPNPSTSSSSSASSSSASTSSASSPSSSAGSSRSSRRSRSPPSPGRRKKDHSSSKDKDKSNGSSKKDRKDRKHKHERSSSSSDSSDDESEGSSQHRKKHKVAPKETRPRLSWAQTGLHVRVISRSLCGGKLYQQGATIEDVSDPYQFTLVMDAAKGSSRRGALIEHVTERDVQTVAGKPGGTVMLVAGPHRGQLATLMKRTLDAKSRQEHAMLQLEQSLEIINTDLDHICEIKRIE
jgi:hypothetical protein